MDKFPFFILNVFINSFLAFFTAALLIELLLFLCRIRQGRAAALLRMIPLLKLPIDLFFYDFSRWAYAHGINPLTCETGTRTLSIMFHWMSSLADWLVLPSASSIQFTVSENLTFTIADLIGHTVNPFDLNVFIVLFISLSVVFIIQKLFLYHRSILALDSLAKTTSPLNKKIHNDALSSRLKKWELPIHTSQALAGSPFVAGLLSSKIYISTALVQHLSRKEYEAVLAHELEHIRHKDSVVRLTLDLIGTLFWWIPTQWLRRRIEEGQEVGCDLKAQKYGIDPTDLASALCKSARYSTQMPPYHFVHHLTKHTTLKRAHILLNPASMRCKKTRFAITSLAIALAFAQIFLGRFWMF